MNIEQILINKWRLLPPEKQEEVIDFVSFLEQNYIHKKLSEKTKQVDWLHGGAEFFLTLSNIFVVLGFRQVVLIKKCNSFLLFKS
jgi:hypothetical protein